MTEAYKLYVQIDIENKYYFKDSNTEIYQLYNCYNY